MGRQIDSKYEIQGNNIIKSSNGRSIPLDEPVILFRASDKISLDLLQVYYRLCIQEGSPQEHVDGIGDLVLKFGDWQAQNPDKVKVPD